MFEVDDANKKIICYIANVLKQLNKFNSVVSNIGENVLHNWGYSLVNHSGIQSIKVNAGFHIAEYTILDTIRIRDFFFDYIELF